MLLAEGDAEGAYERLRQAYFVAGNQDWGGEFIRAEVERLCRARGLPHPSADRTDSG